MQLEGKNGTQMIGQHNYVTGPNITVVTTNNIAQRYTSEYKATKTHVS